MNKFEIAPTQRTPHVVFDPEAGIFLIEGESYPEDVRMVFDEPMSLVLRHLASGFENELVVAFKLRYFNSSTARVIMDLFVAVEESSQRGNKIRVEWHHEADDDNMQELGEEFCEELHATIFSVLAI
jgi:hypothetical protein